MAKLEQLVLTSMKETKNSVAISVRQKSGCTQLAHCWFGGLWGSPPARGFSPVHRLLCEISTWSDEDIP